MLLQDLIGAAPIEGLYQQSLQASLLLEGLAGFAAAYRCLQLLCAGGFQWLYGRSVALP